ncbi:MAG: sensor histidine kinase [Clostridia bacterium]
MSRAPGGGQSIRRSSIGTRFTVGTLVLVFTISLVASVIEGTLSYRREVNRLNQVLSQIRESHIPSLVSSLWLTDHSLLQLQIDAIARFPYVSRVEVEDIDGTLLCSGSSGQEPLQAITEKLEYAHRGSELEIGELRIYIDQVGLRRGVAKELLPAFAGHILVIIAVTIIILLFFRKQIASPLESLAADLEQRTTAQLDIPLVLHRRVDYPDELQVLVGSINILRSRLDAYLKERELLVAEIHHRIKNDITFIKSLLVLQAGQTESPEVSLALNEAGQRVSVMARIYERLYGDDDFLEVALRPLVEQVIQDLLELSGLPPDCITMQVEEISLPTKLSLGIGIILNELVTNAAKYAVKSTATGHVTVTILVYAPENTIEMKVVDDGPGLPEDVVSGIRKGYGLTIVDALVAQHHGSIVFANESGSVVTVSLPLPAAGIEPKQAG